jgi:hypothetical protein
LNFGGAVDAAAITKDGDGDTGLWWPGTNQIGIAAAGANVYRVLSDGTTLIADVDEAATLTANAQSSGLTLFRTGMTTLGAGCQLVLGNTSASGHYGQVGFGYVGNGALNNTPAAIGYKVTTDSGNTKGQLEFGTRDVTTDTAPTVRLTITAGGEITVGTAAYIANSVTTGITAGSTQTQAGATALTSELNIVTVVGTDDDGVALPLAAAGRTCCIKNADAAQRIKIWPTNGSGDAIDGGAGDAADANTLAAGGVRTYKAYDGTNWITFSS